MRDAKAIRVLHHRSEGSLILHSIFIELVWWVELWVDEEIEQELQEWEDD